MEACFYGTINERYEEIIKHWNSKSLITKHIGRIGGKEAKDLNVEKYLTEVSEHLFKLPFHTDFEFSDGMMRRFKREIDNIESNYKSGSLTGFRRMFYVSDAIANKSPVTRKFYNDVNSAVNFERNRLDRYLTSSQQISKYIMNALVQKTGKSKSEMKKYLSDMGKLEEKILSGETSSDSYLAEYNRLFEKHGQGVINDYIKLMETPKSEYVKEINRRDIDTGQIIYSKEIRNAVDLSKNLLNEMGGVYVNGLERMNKVVKMLWKNPLINKSGQAYLDKIENGISKIKKGIEKGNYFPHYLLSHTVEANYRAKALLEASGERQLLKATEQLSSLFSNVETLMPDKARARNEQIQTIWSKNPFFVLTQYSKDAIAFNKISFIQEKFIPTMRKFQKNDSDPAFIRSMRHFIEDTFQIATKGLMERPTWVNATVRSLMAVETLKSMGFSVTGAIRNGASAVYFYTEHGFKESHRAMNDYNANLDGMKEKLAVIEREQGFEFKEGGRELIAEGLIPSGKNITDIVYDPITNKVKYRDRGVLKKLDPIIDKSVGTSLMFHRFTENATRTWMFRVAWTQAYQRLKGHIVGDPARLNVEANDAKIQRMSTNFALKAVNKFAFEYSAHAKARAVGGTAPKGELGPDGLPKMKSKDYASALGELTFQFLHYPMSFLNLQSKVLKGAYDAALSRQGWDAPELQQGMKFAGIFGMVELLSLTTNLDFTNLLENDTVRRLEDLKTYLTAEDDDPELQKMRGLVNDFTGPIVGDMNYGLNMFQLYQMPDERWKKMLTGYIDYYEEGQVPDFVGPTRKLDWDEKRKMWNKLNVEFSRMISHKKSIEDGRGFDILRTELGLYPRSRLKAKRKQFNNFTNEYLGFKPFKDKKGKATTTAEENLLKLIKEMGGTGY